ncbi:MAG: protease inhibitor I9 family protein, partial [Anaerolineae bacterium]
MFQRLPVPVLVVVITSVIAVTLLGASVTSAEPDYTVIDPSVMADRSWVEADDGPLAVVVSLDHASALDLYRGHGGEVGDVSTSAQATLDYAYAAVAADQAPAREHIEGTGATIVSTYDTAANGFLVLATREQVEAISRTPGVRRIYRAPEHTPDMDDVVPLVGAQTVIEELGFTGRGVRVAVIDTGIDYTHKSLGGSGKSADYAGNDPDKLEDKRH